MPAHESFMERIVLDPEILAGKPVIRGTRIPVALILNLMAHDYTIPRIIEAYPDLDADDVRAALQYSEARIQREEIRFLDHSA